MEGFFCVTGLGDLYLEGLIHGGAYFWNFTLFFVQTNQTWICYVKRNYSQKCVILALSHLLCIPK